MNIKETLQSIIHYFEINRGVGHTHTTLYGAVANPNALIVTHSASYLREFKTKVISLGQLDTQLRGRRNPIVFDNAALLDLATAALSQIDALENLVKEKTYQEVLKNRLNFTKVKTKNINHKLFHENYVAFGEAIMNSGENPFTVLKEYEDVLIRLANNNIRITAKYETNTRTEK